MCAYMSMHACENCVVSTIMCNARSEAFDIVLQERVLTSQSQHGEERDQIVSG